MLDVILGGITGLIGSITTAITNYKMQKLKNENDAAERDFKIQYLKASSEAALAEIEANIQVAKTEVEGKIELEEIDAYKKTLSGADKKLLPSSFLNRLLDYEGKLKVVTVPAALLICFCLGLVDVFKALMRPGLTTYMVGMTTWITWMAWEILQKAGLSAISRSEANSIFDDVTTIVIYLTVSCVTWWFGDRRMAKFLVRLKDK